MLARHFGAVGAEDAHGVPPIEPAHRPGHAGRAADSCRSSTRAPRRRRPRWLQPVSGCLRSIACGWPAASKTARTRCSARPPRCAAAGAGMPLWQCTNDTPAPTAILAAAIFVCMPPEPMSLPDPPAMASMAGVISRTRAMNSALGSSFGSAVYRPSMSDNKIQAVGAHHLRDARRQPVVVSIADFGGRHGIVLIDHRTAPSASRVFKVPRAFK